MPTEDLDVALYNENTKYPEHNLGELEYRFEWARVMREEGVAKAIAAGVRFGWSDEGEAER